MKGALRLLRVKVQNVGILGDRAVELGPFVPGVNVISGDNESGKTSIVRALRAALFQRHGSKHESIRTLQPHGNRKAAPRVEVEFELDGTAYLLEKQFMVGVSSRLHTADGTLSLKDDEADQKVFSLLGAREPAKKGTNPDDMGVWSLLWVNQDEFATAEPAERMGDHVRGTLAESIGGIVGDVMGGEHGIHLRRAIEDAYAKVWTPKQTDRATGKLLEARETHERLTAEVKALEQRVKDTETLGADLQAQEQDLERLRADESRLAADVTECARAVDEADVVERAYAEAVTRLQEAERLHAEARTALDRREKLRSDLADVDASVSALREVLDPLTKEAGRTAERLRVAQHAATTARSDQDRLQRRVLELGDAVGRAKVKEDLARSVADLHGARSLAEQAGAKEETLRGLPDESALRELQELETKRARLAEHARRHATRVTVHRSGHDSTETPITHRAVVTLDGLGTVTVEPPREGFLKARSAWREVRATLEATLAAHGVASVGEARTIADRRRTFDAQISAGRQALQEIAPRGITELAVEAERSESARAELARVVDSAKERRAELDRCEQLVASVPIDDAAAGRVESLRERVRHLEEGEAATPTRVTFRPLAAVRVQIGARDIPRILTAGMEVKRPITAVTTVTIGDQLELEIDPGADVRAHSVLLDGARQALSSALEALGVATAEEARAQALQRTEHEARRAQLERELKEKAPKGIDALTDALQRKGQTADSQRQRLCDAQGHDEKIAAAEREVAACAIGAAAFDALDALDRGCLAAEQTMRRLAGRIVAADGLLGDLWQMPLDLVDDLAVEVGGARVEITLGEAAHDLELPGVTRDLERKLRACGVASLEEAIRAHVQWQGLRSEAAELRRSVLRLAPKGVAVLDATVASLQARAGDSTGDEAREVLEPQLAVERKRLEDANADLVRQEARAAAAHVAADEAEVARGKAERAFHDREVEQGVKASALRADEVVAGDAALRAADERATRDVVGARGTHDAALAAREAAMPEVRRRDLERARQIVAEHKRAVDAKHLDIVRHQATLEATLPEGRYEKLAEKRTELEEATNALARLERSARAVKLLRETTEGAYTDAQRTLMKPVYDEAMPLLRVIRPGTTFTMHNDTLHLASVNRNGIEEEFKDLSGGAREQLALVVRIALAKVFARQRLGLPLVLDDVLGWTDDRRLRGMLNVLEQTSRDMQVILLTCHPGRFRGIEGAASFEVQRP